MSQGRRYRILGALGKGGFGTVYRADLLGESGFTRQVALKVLNPDMEGVVTVASRLRDEARLLGLLRHRAIVDVDGLVRLDGRWTVVMEYVAGADLARLMTLGPVPQGPALEIVGEVASALHVAYTTPGPSGEPLRLLHRDIKPQNVIVTPNGEVKVLDFGVARADFAGREAKTRAMLLGSLSYMAPERFDRHDGPGSDVYAMGVVLWEMLTGQHYGRITNREHKFVKRRDEALATLKPLVLSEVHAFVRALMSFHPEDRPSARDVERRCRDLRLEVRGPWLRDWAEDVVPPLVAPPDALEGHDFSSDIVTESRASDEGDLDGGWPEKAKGPASTWTGVQVGAAADAPRAGSLPTLPPDEDDEDDDAPPLQIPEQPALSPESLPPAPERSDAGAVVPSPFSARPARKGPSGMTVFAQVAAIFGVPVVLAGGGFVLLVSAMCCGLLMSSH